MGQKLTIVTFVTFKNSQKWVLAQISGPDFKSGPQIWAKFHPILFAFSVILRQFLPSFLPKGSSNPRFQAKYRLDPDAFEPKYPTKS